MAYLCGFKNKKAVMLSKEILYKSATPVKLRKV